MLEIIYRIYEVLPPEIIEQNLTNGYSSGFYSNSSSAGNMELLMDCLVCDSRDQFKDIIRDTYGKNIQFRYSKKLKPGDVYCIIIGEHCWTTERYFQKKSFICDYCGTTVESYYSNPISFFDSEIRWDFYGIDDYKSKRFCCQKCKEQYKSEELKRLKPEDPDENDFWVTKDSLKAKGVCGWIYKITKKSTNEFYVGQTIHAPIWRWAQHLKTERFPMKHIEDYKFEVIEIVLEGENILEREKYWIQECYKQCPEKSLNIMQTKNIVNK